LTRKLSLVRLPFSLEMPSGPACGPGVAGLQPVSWLTSLGLSPRRGTPLVPVTRASQPSEKGTDSVTRAQESIFEKAPWSDALQNDAHSFFWA
jgi:hypothetical protein